jgi:hypothetical protein
MAKSDRVLEESIANWATLQPRLVPEPSQSASAQEALRRDAAWRHERVATAAYYIAEHRGFAPGSHGNDWGLAESQIDALDGS